MKKLAVLTLMILSITAFSQAPAKYTTKCRVKLAGVIKNNTDSVSVQELVANPAVETTCPGYKVTSFQLQAVKSGKPIRMVSMTNRLSDDMIEWIKQQHEKVHLIIQGVYYKSESGERGSMQGINLIVYPNTK